MTADKAIEAIQLKLNELENINVREDFDIWQKATSSTLRRVIPTNTSLISNFERIQSYVFYVVEGFDKLPEAKKEAKALLESVISDIQLLGMDEPKTNSDHKGVHVNVHQSNHQVQQVEIHISTLIEIFKDELSGKQLKELKEIQDSNDTPESKKKHFFEKLKSFGTDVTAGIVSGILANPDFIQQLTS